MASRPEVIKWSYGVTTVPSRRRTLLRRTLDSLSAAGFDLPRLFVDGDKTHDGASWAREFGLDVTCRGGAPSATYGNWVLSMYELYIREPNATRYAIFQDDMVTYKNLKDYLNRCPYPARGYWSLYTAGSNDFAEMRKAKMTTPPDGYRGWYRSNQLGRGAVAIVMNNATVRTLMATKHMVDRPTHPSRGTRAVDGAIVTALAKEGWIELVHSPSLVEHTGDVSSMGNLPHKKALEFLGENVDAATFPTPKESHYGSG